jgi:hypothetical protein
MAPLQESTLVEAMMAVRDQIDFLSAVFRDCSHCDIGAALHL